MTGSPWRPWERFMRKPEPEPRGRHLGDILADEESGLWVKTEPLRGSGVTPGVRELRASQGKAVPAFLPRHKYGAGNTVHPSGTIDVQVDSKGRVVAVWFRCLSLPFTVSQGREDIQPDIAIEEITYVDLDREDDSQ